jgi:hypothetical protein
MKFAYEDLSSEQFEKLIVILCQHLFGISVQGFAKGPDGGRDAKFEGTAELFPSKADPWKGTVIIQAKHTNGQNRSFSEKDFYSKKNNDTIVGKEILRIRNLRKKNKIDHYILFSNRRLTAMSESEIRDHIADECEISASSIYLCGLEQLELFLKQFPKVAKDANLDPVDTPLIVSPDDLAEIVQALAIALDSLTSLEVNAPIERISFEKKNTLNNMTEGYASELLRKYLKETVTIRNFLAAPENMELLKKYESASNEFQFKIIAHRNDYQTFDKIIEYLVDLLFHRNAVLSQTKHKRLTRAIIFYMYWNCDIGGVDDAAPNETLTS